MLLFNFTHPGAIRSDEYNRACIQVEERGYRVSAGSWEDHDRGSYCVFSVETWGPTTYNAPKACFTGRINPPRGGA